MATIEETLERIVREAGPERLALVTHDPDWERRAIRDIAVTMQRLVADVRGLDEGGAAGERDTIRPQAAGRKAKTT